MELSAEIMLEESLSFLIETLGFEKEEAESLIKEYIVFLDEEITTIESALKSSDFAVISRSAHSLKGSAGNSKLDGLAELALTLEGTAKIANIEACNQTFNDIKQCVTDLKLAFAYRMN